MDAEWLMGHPFRKSVRFSASAGCSHVEVANVSAYKIRHLTVYDNATLPKAKKERKKKIHVQSLCIMYRRRAMTVVATPLPPGK